MDKLVTVDVEEICLNFRRSQKLSFDFCVKSLMHTIAVATEITTTRPLFSIKPQYLSIIPPLSSSSFSVCIEALDRSPFSFQTDKLLIRSSMLPTGKADFNDLRKLFAKPGKHIYKTVVPIYFVGDDVVQSLITSSSIPDEIIPERSFLISKVISFCNTSQISELLCSAVRIGSSWFLSSLISAGGDLNFRDSNGQSLLSIAISSGHVEIVKFLLESGSIFDPNVDHFLHQVVLLNRLDLLKILLESSTSREFVNSVDSLGRTAIHVAAHQGNVDAIRLCISFNGDPSCVDFNGWTPIHYAASEGHLKTIEFLLDYCYTSKYALTKDGRTPFLLAIDGDHTQLLDTLHLGDVLQRSACLGDVHGLKSCISQGANVNQRDQNGWTPLHRAVYKRKIEIVKLLIDNGAEVDVVDDEGYTPLRLAVELEHTEVVDYLISYGAQIRNNTGKCSINSDTFMNPPTFDRYK